MSRTFKALAVYSKITLMTKIIYKEEEKSIFGRSKADLVEL